MAPKLSRVATCISDSYSSTTSSSSSSSSSGSTGASRSPALCIDLRGVQRMPEALVFVVCVCVCGGFALFFCVYMNLIVLYSTDPHLGD
jgi:hypothetical protein